MGDYEIESPAWWFIHESLWEAEFDTVRGDDMAEKEDGEFKTWLSLWKGFPGALFKVWGLLAVVFVVGWLLLH